MKIFSYVEEFKEMCRKIKSGETQPSDDVLKKLKYSYWQVYNILFWLDKIEEELAKEKPNEKRIKRLSLYVAKLLNRLETLSF